MTTQKNTDSTSPLLEAALGHAARGRRVIPLHTFAEGLCTCESPTCGSPAKHPLTPNGVHGATTDETTILRWWQEADIANVGVATGQGLLVLDIDAKHGGLESLARLEAEHGPLPTTPTVATGGGGRHYYFGLPDGETASNRAGLAPGVDVRADGGYVVAPPSLHASGRRYEWITPPDMPTAGPPAWLMAMLGIGSRSATAALPSATVKSNGLKLVVRPTAEDLTTHPGVGEGQRNDTLCRLIGVHLARGESAEDIEPLALDWAGRCSPPLDEAEVLRALGSLAAKHRRSIPMVSEEADDDLDSMPLPEPPEWPKIEPDALHGLIGDIVRTLEPETEADPFGILLSTLVAFGSAVGRGPHFAVEGDHHQTNLFAVLVGESSHGRKGTSLGRTLAFFDEAEPEWKADCIATGLSSGEGLIWALRDPVEAMEAVKEKGKVAGYESVVKDQGVTDKRRLVIEPEFAQTLKVLKREGNTLSPVIRQAWDSGALTAMTKNNFARATGTHVSILGHITRPELAKCLSDTDCFNGFANRFLWALVRRSKLLPDGGRGLDLGPIKDRLASALSVAKSIGAMNRSPEARALWHRLYPELTAERAGLYGAVVGRGEAQTLRLSMLYALLDGVAEIGEAHLRAAAAVWRYCEASARIIFDGEADADDPLERLLLQVIRGEPGINRRGLHKSIGGHMPAREMVQALGRLRDRGRVRCESIATGGRPSECWFPAVTPTLIPVVIVTPSPTPEAPPVATPSSTSTTEAVLVVAEETPEPSGLTLAELFGVVNTIGGRLRREGDGCVVEAPADRITPIIKAALIEHRESLLALLPAPAVGNETGHSKDGREISKAEFLAELAGM